MARFVHLLFRKLLMAMMDSNYVAFFLNPLVGKVTQCPEKQIKYTQSVLYLVK